MIMQVTRIAELLAPFLHSGLSEPQLVQISVYLNLLLKWNARTNLTAVREPEQIVTRHFGESLFVAEHLLRDEFPDNAIDVGSGAGFPGIPLAIYAAALKVQLVESQGKKATFLKEASRAASLGNIAICSDRAETLVGQTSAKLVTMRAVERFAHTLPVAAKLVARDGRLALLIGTEQAPSAVVMVPRFHWSDPVAIPQSSRRILMIGRAPAT
jgi:16S rRNA (guanine527-N7)-methyltransferase